MVGNVDAGKSTLLGVLTHSELDNGRGHARQRLFRHKHEMESGRTSSVGNDILGTVYPGSLDQNLRFSELLLILSIRKRHYYNILFILLGFDSLGNVVNKPDHGTL